MLCRTASKEKPRYTIVLSTMADGTRLKQIIIFKGLKNIPDFTKDVVVAVSMKWSMNYDLMNIRKKYIRKKFGVFVLNVFLKQNSS